MRKIFFLLLTMICCMSARSEVKLPRFISDGMVLQRNVTLKIWGWASSGEKVHIEFLGKSYNTTANENGEWSVSLPPQQAGGAYDMKINDKILTNILIGDVWLCSGQSNMELPINRVLRLYKSEVDTAHNHFIRYIKTPLKYSFERPLRDIDQVTWEEVDPVKVLNFSAVVYFFAADLYKKYKIPIGIINSSVGGSPIEAWLSEDALKKYPSYMEVADKFSRKGYIDSIRRSENMAIEHWNNDLDRQDKGLNKWYLDNTNTSGWETIAVPSYWADKGLGLVNGSFWFRKDIHIDAALAGESAVLDLGCIVDKDSVYINGRFVGTTAYRYPPRIYKIPQGILRKGRNTITIRVISASGRGGFVEDKPYRLTIGDKQIDLTGEWKYKVGAIMPPQPSQTFFQYKPMGLFNGMIAPLTDYKFKGILWYQGESNTDRADEYQSMLSSLITDWRNKWNDTLPFLYVQLPNFMQISQLPSPSNWAMLREAQLNTLKIPRTGMVVAIDLGEWNDIHPLNKKDIGHRLSLAAQRVAYGDKSVVSSGPLYQSMSIRGDSIFLSFSETSTGFYTNDKLSGFAIAGSDRQFVWANAKVEGNKVIVWSDRVRNPVAVRYAWADNPGEVNFRNKEGLPASPFRTDTWNK